jgi:methionyl-tRNA formyltransferase
MHKNNFIFWGTPDVASKTLEILKQNGFLPILIITAIDKKAGRKMLLTPPSVKVWAIENKIPYLQPEKITDDFINSLPETDLNIVIAYGKILKENLIKKPKLGSINVHYSLLPKWRGASPLESALLHGDDKTGITIQQMEYEMDSGPIIETVEVPVSEKDTILELKEKLINLGADTLVKILPKIFNKNIQSLPQNHNQATFCKKIKKEDGLIHFDKETDINIYNKYRAYKIWPRIYFFKNNKRIIITQAELEKGKFVIKKIIPEGGKEQDYK